MNKIFQTQVADDIDATKEKITLDKQIKVVLANKPILARILAHSMKEFKGIGYDAIMACIEGEPEVGTVAVAPGKTNLVSDKISGSATEDTVPNEGTIYFDIRLYVRIPGCDKTEPVKILVNIEAQKSFYPGYDIVTRAIYYCARMLSAQLSTEFTVATDDKVKYDNIKKVYSIWICMDTSNESENTIDEYHIERQSLVGHNKKTARYDLMSVVMICLSKNKNASNTDNELLKMLLTLLDENLDAEEKKKRLEREHGIPMTVELAQEVNDMCNLSEYYEEMAVKKDHIEKIKKMISKGYSKEDILDLGYTKEEYAEAESQSVQLA